MITLNNNILEFTEGNPKCCPAYVLSSPSVTQVRGKKMETKIITKTIKVVRDKKGTFKYNDGGRKDAGYKGDAGDCVVRAIAIALELPYQQVYDELKEANKVYSQTKRTRQAKKIKSGGTTPRNGNYRKVYEPYIESKGWEWVPTMKVGQGCRVHLTRHELPSGRLIVRVSKHLTTMIDGVINDTYNPSRDGTRCVYGYYQKRDDRRKALREQCIEDSKYLPKLEEV